MRLAGARRTILRCLRLPGARLAKEREKGGRVSERSGVRRKFYGGAFYPREGRLSRRGREAAWEASEGGGRRATSFSSTWTRRRNRGQDEGSAFFSPSASERRFEVDGERMSRRRSVRKNRVGTAFRRGEGDVLLKDGLSRQWRTCACGPRGRDGRRAVPRPRACGTRRPA